MACLFKGHIAASPLAMILVFSGSNGDVQAARDLVAVADDFAACLEAKIKAEATIENLSLCYRPKFFFGKITQTKISDFLSETAGW
jgi:hypothetical protein